MAPFQILEHHIDEALENESWATLNDKAWVDLIDLCVERGLNTNGDKATLIQLLLDWKQNTRPVPAPSTPHLLSTEGSNDSRSRVNPDLMSTLFIDSKIQYSDLEVGKKLGSGGFKDCFAGKYNGEPIAIGELRIKSFNEFDIKEIKHEIDVLKQLRHENVVRFIGVCIDPKHFCIITELCDNGDMFDYMRRNPRVPLSQQIRLMHDISMGVSYLHTRRPIVIHRDLKSMNILISSDLRAKINDFGLARILPKADKSMHTQCGTPNWQAPEFWSPNPSYTEKVDVYACGLIFWEVMTWAEQGYPYQNYSEHQLYEAVRDRGLRPPTDMLKKFPQILDLVEEMWRRDPSQRPSMGNVVERLIKLLS